MSFYDCLFLMTLKFRMQLVCPLFMSEYSFKYGQFKMKKRKSLNFPYLNINLWYKNVFQNASNTCLGLTIQWLRFLTLFYHLCNVIWIKRPTFPVGQQRCLLLHIVTSLSPITSLTISTLWISHVSEIHGILRTILRINVSESSEKVQNLSKSYKRNGFPEKH